MSSKQEQRKTVATLALVLGIVGVVTLGVWSNTGVSNEKENASLSLHSIVEGPLVKALLEIMAELGKLSGDGGDDDSVDEIDRISELEAEVDQLTRTLDDLEGAIAEISDDAADLAEVSGFSIDEYRPANGAKLAGKVIEFRGRTRYTMSFKIKQTGKTSSSSYGSIINVGDSSGKTRSPGLWVYPNSRRLHIRQALENSDGDYSHSSTWNRGCDPSTADTPAIGTQYKVEIIADSKFFTVKFNGEEVCRKAADVLPPPGQQTVWIGRPGTPAPAVIKNMKFEIL